MPQSMQHFYGASTSSSFLGIFKSLLPDGRLIHSWRIHHTKGRALNLCAVGNKNLLSTDKRAKAK